MVVLVPTCRVTAAVVEGACCRAGFDELEQPPTATSKQTPKRHRSLDTIQYDSG